MNSVSQFLKRFLPLTCLALFAFNAKAQTETDALRHSETTFGGTARSQAMAGAFTAVGADFSNLNINPAGLALFTRSQLQITPALQFFDTDADLLGTRNSQLNTNFSIPSLGLVIHGVTKKKSGLTSYSIGLGFNTMQQYRRHAVATGFNAHNSITNFFADRARGINPNDLARLPDFDYGSGEYAAMAFNTFFGQSGDTLSSGILDEWDGNARQYIGGFQYGGIRQTVDRLEKGRTNEWGISFAGNFDDRFHIGATLGIVDVSYSVQAEHLETDDRGNYNVARAARMRLNSISFREENTQEAMGVNLSLGAIYQPIDQLRIGVSFKTPSILTFTDRYSTSMHITGDEGQSSNNRSVENLFEYILYTPGSINGGVAFIGGKKVILALDGGFTPMASASFGAVSGGDAAFFSSLNSAVGRQLQTSYNIRLGGELKVTESAYIRAGFGYYTTPYSDSGREYGNLAAVTASSTSAPVTRLASDRMVYSFGLGTKGKTYFFDAALFIQRQADLFRLYNVSGNNDGIGNPRDYSPFFGTAPVATFDRTWVRIAFTVGVNFGKGD